MEVKYKKYSARNKILKSSLGAILLLSSCGFGSDAFGMDQDPNNVGGLIVQRRVTLIGQPQSIIRPAAKVKKSPPAPNDDIITNISRFAVALEQEGEGLHDIANHNYHLSLGEETDKDFCSSSIIVQPQVALIVQPRQPKLRYYKEDGEEISKGHYKSRRKRGKSSFKAVG